MMLSLQRMAEDGALGPVHVALAELIGRLDAAAGDEVVLGAAIASDQLARGHVCLDLASVAQITFSIQGAGERFVRYDDWPPRDAWIQKLRASAAVEVRDCADDAENLERPLVLDVEHGKLYLARYWYYQQKLAKNISARVGAPPMVLDETRLVEGIELLFPDRAQPGGRDQCVAAANAVDQRFSVITGGPGSGKTTTVAKLLALRLMQALDPGALKVVLMAPTGKAAQRLNESLGRVTAQLRVPREIRARLEVVKAGTIHRMLGWTPVPPERGGPFRHGAESPLDADVIVVDEASMVDLGLLWRLFDAIRPEAQVVLMGDRDQLASIEAGGVLGDLCGDASHADPGRMSASRRTVLEQRTGMSSLSSLGSGSPGPLADHVITLRHSHRFDPAGVLGRLALCVRGGDDEGVIESLRGSDPALIRWSDARSTDAARAVILQEAVAHYEPYLELLHENPRGSLEVLRRLNRFRILCAHRSGVLGESNLNQGVAGRLVARGRIAASRGLHPGSPIMVTRNSYHQQLFNGDVGVLVQGDESEAGGVFGLFEDSSAEAGGYRRVPAALIPAPQACYAITIHKSQGSEFHRVLVVLPERPSPILTRELLYTAVTRVSDEVDAATGARSPGTLHLVGSEAVIRAAVAQRIRRTSGLSDALALS